MPIISPEGGSPMSEQPEQEEEEYYVYPLFPDIDTRIHTDEHLFCDELDCPCHEDGENLETLQSWYDDGLVGPDDGDLIYRGLTFR